MTSSFAFLLGWCPGIIVSALQPRLRSMEEGGRDVA